FIIQATNETIETILDAVNLKKKRKQKLVVVGCFAERYPKEIKEEIPEIDLLFGTGKYSQAGEILSKHFPEYFQEKTHETEILKRNLHVTSKKKASSYAYVKISDGCNRNCYFCIIPTLRGSFKDAPKEQVLQDTKKALEQGAKEICLVSQDTVFYGKSLEDLTNLIQTLTELEELKILRPLYLYPDKKTYKLLDLFLNNEKIAPYFESPIQHVSERVLKSMNRFGNKNFFIDLFSKARQRKDLEIRTSIIMGYPGETAQDVDEVIQFILELKPEKLALFGFSPQEGTRAYSLAEQLDEKEIAHRVNLVREVHLEVLKEIHISRVGNIYPAIVDEVRKNETIVRRFQDAPEMDELVYVKNPNLTVGQIGKVQIENFSEYDMDGVFLEE
ncbi:MAG: MiaB/RimO family radical SAM methylthiotransferase, partial [Leptospiraceae bacterium]|nr:MiaB/RimO family radical SAM methylthiotransferase [Leptospiraceae bacterium]